MKTFGLAMLAAIAGYVVGFSAGYGAISAMSTNAHDKSLEAAMTAALVTGPLLAVLAVIATIVFRSRSSRS